MDDLRPATDASEHQEWTTVEKIAGLGMIGGAAGLAIPAGLANLDVAPEAFIVGTLASLTIGAIVGASVALIVNGALGLR